MYRLLDGVRYWCQMAVSRRATLMSTPQYILYQCLCSHKSHSQLLPPQEILRDHLWPEILWSHCYFPGSQCTWELMWTLQCQSFYFSQSHRILAINPHWPSKPDALGAPSLAIRPSGWEPDVGLRTLTPVRESLEYNYFPVFESSTHHV